MTRKDSEKDSERPHYYSQFWLDVAAGRRVIGAPKPNEEAELVETEMQEAPTFRRPVRNPMTDNVKHSFTPDTDGYRETAPEPAVEQEEVKEPDVDELEQENDLEDEMALPSLDVEDTEIPDMDLTSPEEEEIEEEEEEDFFDEEEEDEDIEWTARGRKKPKPGRPGKQPPSLKPPKRGKRDQRRGF